MSEKEGVATELANYIRWTVLDPQSKEMFERAIKALRAGLAATSPSGSAVAMREALEEIRRIAGFPITGASRQTLAERFMRIARYAKAALAAPQAQEGEREVLIHECAAIADKYDDCGGAFIAQKIRDLLAVSRPHRAPGGGE